MGQTQILFIVLSVIIVGIAVAVGITQFGENAVDANKNAVLLDCQQIVARAQQWYRKPASLGGGGGKFTGCSLDALGVAQTNDNTNATGFALAVNDSVTITVTGQGRENKKDGTPVQVQMVYDATTGTTTTTFP